MADEARHPQHEEGATALRNGVKLASSLVLTWGVALVIAFKLPKYLGPHHLGIYKWGLDYATTLAVFLGFGVDTYISREVAVRPRHASDFFGGVVLMRSALLIPLFLFGWFNLQHKLPEERTAALLFGFTQIFVVFNNSFQQTLQAASQVGGLAIANVVAKLLWGGGTLAAVLLGAPFWTLPLPMLAAEALKAAFLYSATREAVGLELRINIEETKKVLRIAFPFFIANAAVSFGQTLDTVILRELVPSDSEEVGWYGSASMIAKLSALLSPALSGVLVPMMSRAKQRSEEEFFVIFRRGLEAVLVIAIPLTLMLALGADFIVLIALKASFIPAAKSLQWLAPTFVLAYANVLLWVALMILDRSWTITIVSFIGLALLPSFILLIHPFVKNLGDGSTAMGVAMALSARELIIAVIFFIALGRRAVDQRSMGSIAKSLGICCATIAVHVSLASFGNVRLIADLIVYPVLLVLLGVVRPKDVIDILKMVKNRKQLQA